MSMNRLDRAKDLWQSGYYNYIYFYNAESFFNISQWEEIKQKFQSGISFQFFNNNTNEPLTGNLYIKTADLPPQYAENNIVPVSGDNSTIYLTTVIGDIFTATFPNTTGYSVNDNYQSVNRIIDSRTNLVLKLIFSDNTTYIMPTSNPAVYVNMLRLIKYKAAVNEHFFRVPAISSIYTAFINAHPGLTVGSTFSAYTTGLDTLGNTLIPYQSPTYTIREIYNNPSSKTLSIFFNEAVSEEKRLEYRNNIQLTASTTSADVQTIVSVNSTPIESQIIVPNNLNLSSLSIDENSPVNTVIGLLSATDPGDTLTYAVATNTSNFNILNNELRSSVVFDYTQTSSQKVTIRVTDSSGAKAWKDFYININSVSTGSAPTSISLSNNMIAENSPINTIIGTLSTSDLDVNDTFTYTIVSGADKFNLSENSLRSSVIFDYEAQQSHSVTIRSTDSAGASVENTFTILVADVYEAPVNTAPSAIVLDNLQIAENATSRAHVANISATDAQNNVASYSITGGADASMFEIYETSKLRLAPNVLLDYETKPNLSVAITATDTEGLSYQQFFIISVTDVSESSAVPEFQLGHWAADGGPAEATPVVVSQSPLWYMHQSPTGERYTVTSDAVTQDPRISVPILSVTDSSGVVVGFEGLPTGSVVKALLPYTDPVTFETTTAVQKFFKVEGAPYEFTAIEVAAKPTWDWPEDGSIGWNMLQSL